MDGRKCRDCLHRNKLWRGDGWCYMFEKQPRFTKCGQKSDIDDVRVPKHSPVDIGELCMETDESKKE